MGTEIESSRQAELFKSYWKALKAEQTYVVFCAVQGSATQDHSPQCICSHLYQTFYKTKSFSHLYQDDIEPLGTDVMNYRRHWFAVELQNSWQSLSAEWQPLCGGTVPLAALCFRDNIISKCTVSALVEPNGPMALLHNHDALANIPLANKTPFIHPQLCMNHCRVHQSSCFCLHSPCRILLSPTLLQSKSSLREADRDRENPGLSCILSSPGM